MPDSATYPSPTAKASVTATASGFASSGTARATDSLTTKSSPKLPGASGCCPITCMPSDRVSVGMLVTLCADRELVRTAWPVGDDFADELVAHHDVAIGIPHEHAGCVVRIRMIHVVDVRCADRRAERPQQQLARTRHGIRRLTNLEVSASQHDCGCATSSSQRPMWAVRHATSCDHLVPARPVSSRTIVKRRRAIFQPSSVSTRSSS